MKLTYTETIELWLKVKAEIVELQKKERELREGLFLNTFPFAREGANTLNLPDGRRLTGTKKFNRSLVSGEWEKLQKSQQAVLINAGVVSMEPEFSLAGYRKAEGEVLELANRVIEIKPAMPELKLTEPKGKQT